VIQGAVGVNMGEKMSDLELLAIDLPWPLIAKAAVKAFIQGVSLEDLFLAAINERVMQEQGGN